MIRSGRARRVTAVLVATVGTVITFSFVQALFLHLRLELLTTTVGTGVAAIGITYINRLIHRYERTEDELRQSRSALLRSEAQLRGTFEQMMAGVITADVRGIVTSVNVALAERLGYTPEDVIGRHYGEFAHPDESKEVSKRITSLRNREIPGFHAEYRMRHAAGHYIWFSVATSLVFDDDGNIVHSVTQTVDIDDKKQLEAAVAQEQEFRMRLLAVLSDMGEGVAVGEGNRIVWVNDAYAAIAGYTPEDLIGRPSTDLMEPQMAEMWLSRREAIDSGAVATSRVAANILKKDNSLVPIEGATQRVVMNGRTQRVSVVRDVSERRRWDEATAERNQELAQANERLKAANQLKTDLVGMLSHELGQPLTTIRGYSEMLAEDWDGVEDDFRQAGVSRIADAAQRLSRIVDEVLTMVRIDADAIKASTRRLELRSVVDGAVGAITDSITCEITVNVPHGLLVQADPVHLHQVVVNLLSNACKYGQAPFVVTASDAEDRVHLTVEDHGTGVPDEFVPHLFERFARGHDEGSDVKGTGLGLFIVRGLLQAAGAAIYYEKGETCGSRFVVDMPAAAALPVKSPEVFADR